MCVDYGAPVSPVSPTDPSAPRSGPGPWGPPVTGFLTSQRASQRGRLLSAETLPGLDGHRARAPQPIQGVSTTSLQGFKSERSNSVSRLLNTSQSATKPDAASDQP